MRYKVAVIMSTYNGEAYLNEQINSILNQKDVDTTLFIRDDGSCDKTLEILDAYKSERVVVTVGNNLGVGYSFMQQLYDIETPFDYYAFSDQDDIWLDNKLVSAINMIKVISGPAVYCSNQLLVDEEGKQFDKRFKTPIDTSYMRILCNNDVTGCTMVWNAPLNQLIVDAKRRPSTSLLKKRMHDVWIAMVAAVAGCVVYDEKAYILYRQHSNNVVGVKHRSIVLNWLNKIKNPALRNGRSALAKEIIEKYEDVIDEPAIIEQLTVIADYRSNILMKLNVLKDISIPITTRESTLMFRLKVLFNLF